MSYKGVFFGVSVVKRFNGIILYIRYPAGVPYLAPYLIRAGQVSMPERRTILKRFITAARTPGGTIDRTRNGKLN